MNIVFQSHSVISIASSCIQCLLLILSNFNWRWCVCVVLGNTIRMLSDFDTLEFWFAQLDNLLDLEPMASGNRDACMQSRLLWGTIASISCHHIKVTLDICRASTPGMAPLAAGSLNRLLAPPCSVKIDLWAGPKATHSQTCESNLTRHVSTRT